MENDTIQAIKSCNDQITNMFLAMFQSGEETNTILNQTGKIVKNKLIHLYDLNKNEKDKFLKLFQLFHQTSKQVQNMCMDREAIDSLAKIMRENLKKIICKKGDKDIDERRTETE